MYILQLNDMRASNIENVQPIFRADTPEELQKFMDDEKVEPYSDNDGQWHKVFRKGGPLEWCNHPYSFDQYIINVGSVEDWVVSARQNYEDQVMVIPVLK